MDFVASIEHSAIAEAIRFGRWTYPLVNAGHIIGVALLFGAILPLDLRLMGLWSSIQPYALVKVLIPVAGCGLGLALLTGPLLFIVDPGKYTNLWLFWVKLGLIGLAVANLVLLRFSLHWRDVVLPSNELYPLSSRLVLAGGVSAVLWVLVIISGRLLAYL